MRPVELGLVYALVGLAVALAHWHKGRSGALWSLVLWPLFLPGLLAAEAVTTEVAGTLGPAPSPSSAGPVAAAPDPSRRPATADTPWDRRVQAVLTGLREALGGWELDGLAQGSVLAIESGLHGLLDRRRQLEAVRQDLPTGAPAGSSTGPGGEDEALPALAAARRRHHAQLDALVHELDGRLEADLADLTELTTQVLRARYTGAGADDVRAELARLAGVVAAVEESGRVARTA